MRIPLADIERIDRVRRLGLDPRLVVGHGLRALGLAVGDQGLTFIAGGIDSLVHSGGESIGPIGNKRAYHKDDGSSPTVRVGSALGIPSPPAVAFDARQSDVIQYGPISGPLDTDASTIGVNLDSIVRRLTPRECERLQGFPDDWTLIPWRGRPAEDCPDGPRYRALGNSMATNCMEWIGDRIAAWEERCSKSWD